MASKPTSPLRRAWFRWKALRLPWRKKFLVGLDLSGATFWEFADKLSPSPTRMRRIMQPPSHLHNSDVTAQISPAWHQWLRHTRQDPPSLTEQSQDLIRQEQLKVLAAQADARWEAKKRYIDAPEAPGRELGQALPALKPRDPGGYVRDKKLDVDERSTEEAALENHIERPQTMLPGDNGMQVPDGKRHPFVRGERTSQTKKAKEEEKSEDPWKKARGGPSEEWQPQAWDPHTLAARR